MARPRKQNVRREPSGRIARSQTANLQREVDAIRKLSLAFNWESPLGRMRLAEKITQRQFEAGVRFSEARKAADRALGIPSRHGRAQDLSAVRGSSVAVEDDEDIRRKKRAVALYDAAVHAVGWGSPELAGLEIMVVYERTPVYEQVVATIDGLNKLATHWKMQS